MRPSRGGNDLRRTEGLPVVEFALILWLFFIFVLVVTQAHHVRQPRSIDAGASVEGARHDAMYSSHCSSACGSSLNPTATMPQVGQKSVHGLSPNATGTASLVHNPASLTRPAGSGLIVRVNCQHPNNLGEVG